MRGFVCLGMTAVFAACAAPAQAGLITITDNWVGSYVSDGSSIQEDASALTSIPASDILTATKNGNVSTTNYAVSESGGDTLFEFAWQQVRTGIAGAYANSLANAVVFTANADATYSITGQQQLAGDNTVYFSVQLKDETSSAVLFNTLLISDDTVNETLILGETGGDLTNVLEGLSDGSLEAGHEYSLTFYAYTRAWDYSVGNIADAGATADGWLNLNIGEVTVPEPSSLVLLCVGGFGLCGYRRRNARAWRLAGRALVSRVTGR